ncbi:MAG: NlpC/P60 family protein [Chlamydiae bacterium]|nr:NlpC/P60 family protein [Chlamydiota bacterium]
MAHPIHRYARAINFTPIFNTFTLKSVFGGDDGKTLPLKNNLLKELEMIAFPTTRFSVIKRIQDIFLVEVKMEEYPSSTPLYVDERFLEYHEYPLKERVKELPPLSSILETMKSFLGAPYLWGGNCRGVPDMLHFYPPKVEIGSLDKISQHTWGLEGMDCSGLLYFAASGFTPRNTSSLISYGNPVKIQGKNREDWNLLPGDLLVWKGHVIIVLNGNTVIESLGGRGVITTPLAQRLEEIETVLKRKPIDSWDSAISLPENERYVIRRWHPDLL